MFLDFLTKELTQMSGDTRHIIPDMYSPVCR